MLLTRNEERNIEACLDSLAQQTETSFEVIVVDAASTDRTVDIVRRVQPTYPLPLRLDACDRRLPIGEARNRGVAMAQAPLVAFLSADAEAETHWVEEALRSLECRNMAFGQQIHDPHRWTVGAAVRGLRYHFPKGNTPEPLRYASNVAAAYEKEILVKFPFDEWSNAAEDLLLAHRAHEAGYRAAYNPRMIVCHHDVATAREELRKNVREGRGWGLYRDELGLFGPVLGWGLAILAAFAIFLWRPGWWTFLLLPGILWLPALRRGLRRLRAMPLSPLLKGVAASPAFDIAFLFHYVRGLVDGSLRKNAKSQTKET